MRNTLNKIRAIAKISRIVDTTTILPNSSSAFQSFYAPYFNGNAVVFYGANQTYEGIYYAPISDNVIITRISDNHTPIQDLNGPPTTNGSSDAYVAYTSGSIQACCSQLNNPRPIMVGNKIVFFAANWNTNKSGIFAFDQQSQTYTTLVSNSTGIFTSGQFGQPSSAPNMGMVYFTGVGRSNAPLAGNTPPQGIFMVPPTGPEGIYPRQVFNGSIAKAALNSHKYPLDNFGNCQIFPLRTQMHEAILFFFGDCAVPTTMLDTNGILSHIPSGLQFVVPPGQKFGTYTVSQSGAYPEVSASGNIIAFNTQLTDSYKDPCPGLIALVQGKPILVCAGEGEIPGGSGIFSGSFAQPPVTDGTRIAFEADYENDDGSGSALFVWNSQTNNITQVLNMNTLINGQPLVGIDVTPSSFVNGKLTAMITSGVTGPDEQLIYGIYLIDLSAY